MCPIGADVRQFRLKTGFYAIRVVWQAVAGTMTVLMESGGIKKTWRARLRLLQYGFVSPGLFRMLIVRLLEYVHPRYNLTFSHAQVSQLKAFEDKFYATAP